MPQYDSSQTYTPAVWPEPSPADLRRFPAGGSEVSRFSCMKFLGVPGVFDYAGRVLTFTLLGLFPTACASLRWTHLHAGLARRTNISIALTDLSFPLASPVLGRYASALSTSRVASS